MLNLVVDRFSWALLSFPIVVLAAILVSGCAGCSFEPPPGEPIQFDTGKDFIPFELPDLAGQNRKLSEFLNQSTLVSFFFPTCGACNQEMPHFQRFYEKYQDRGLSVVGVNVIPDQDELVPHWRDNNGITFPILVGAETNTLIENYRLSATPLSFLLNAEGKIISRQDGYTPGSEARIEAHIREALGL
jgi:peroxiredoxin